MSAQHTPGPWKYSRVTKSVFGKSGSDLTAIVYGANDNEEWANGKLIAAAPELLEALIDATDNCLWRSDSEYPLSTEESARIFQKAMAAIAKAKGETK